MKTIYCISYIDPAGNGVNQFDSAEARAQGLGKTGGVDEVPFEVTVSDDADADAIEVAIDQQYLLVRGDIPVTPAFLALAMTLQTAADAYIAEGILARTLKLPEPNGYITRCELLFDQYAKAMPDIGILQHQRTFETLLRAKPSEDMLQLDPAQLPKLWRFNPMRGWMPIGQA